MLKYAFGIRCDSYDVSSDGRVEALFCSVIDSTEKPKGTIQWVDKSTAVGIEVRLYEPLFTTEEPSDDSWEEELNKNSEIVVTNALCDPHVVATPPECETHFQFERLGFFVVDKDSKQRCLTANDRTSGLVFNLTVGLKDSKPKDATMQNRSRKEEQARQLAEKVAKMSISPQDFFRTQTDLYSAFDEDGVPTHDAAGAKLSKSAYKSLKKEWEKQKKLYEKGKAASN